MYKWSTVQGSESHIVPTYYQGTISPLLTLCAVKELLEVTGPLTLFFVFMGLENHFELIQILNKLGLFTFLKFIILFKIRSKCSCEKIFNNFGQTCNIPWEPKLEWVLSTSTWSLKLKQSLWWDPKNRGPVTQLVCSDKDPSMVNLKACRCRSQA